ncbi:MAG: acetate--CoA ligase [Steroidobacteraceae bacterium]
MDESNISPIGRVSATAAARELIEELKREHGPLMFHLSGGCCDGSAPMCFKVGEFKLGGVDEKVGDVVGCEFWMDREQFRRWEHTRWSIDVVPGRGASFSLEAPLNQRFLIRSSLCELPAGAAETLTEPRVDRIAPEQKLYSVPSGFAAAARIRRHERERAYTESIQEPERFWGKVARRIDWIKPFSSVKDTSFAPEDFHIRWFSDGELNVAANCLDRHLATRADKTAIIWEADEPGRSERISYRELHQRVCRCANALKSLGVGKGDRVTIYLPMVPEIAIAMLACARIGAVHSVVFGGFSAEALAGRIGDCQSSLVITADEGVRGGKRVPLKANVDTALDHHAGTGCVRHVLVVRRTGAPVAFNAARDHWYDECVGQQSADCPPVPVEAEHPLFVLHTSGSTGKPKGVLHTSGGYLVFAAYTHETIFDLREEDIYWATADIGWVTGHSYIVYGPLANGATTLLFEGVPSYPDFSRFWQVVDEHRVSILYSSPTAIRSLMREGAGPVQSTSRKSLRLLGSVGEPINPEAWQWFHRVVGEGRCPIVDTWWQTETGGILISPLPGAVDLKPGSATLPFFGVQPAIVDGEGRILEGACEGNLVLLDSWPGQMRTVYGDHQRFIDTYFKTFTGMYFTGDGARRDADGYYWITGRVDDVLNVAGHRLGTAEIESAMVAHPRVAEAAVVGFPHDIKGQGIYVYVTLNSDSEPSEPLRTELRNWVRKEISPIASPDVIQWAPALPKTRSGKIMRRILRKIAASEFDQLGDLSTLAEPAVVEQLIRERQRS